MGRSFQTARAALTIASSLACMVRGCEEGAAHYSGGRARRCVEYNNGQAVRHGRRAAMASSYGHWWRVLLVVRIRNESAASRCPSWWQAVPGGGRILPGISPPCRSVLGKFSTPGAALRVI